jgi:hypothetical protein
MIGSMLPAPSPLLLLPFAVLQARSPDALKRFGEEHKSCQSPNPRDKNPEKRVRGKFLENDLKVG